MQWLDGFFEQRTRAVAQRSARRSALARIGRAVERFEYPFKFTFRHAGAMVTHADFDFIALPEQGDAHLSALRRMTQRIAHHVLHRAAQPVRVAANTHEM